MGFSFRVVRGFRGSNCSFEGDVSRMTSTHGASSDPAFRELGIASQLQNPVGEYFTVLPLRPAKGGEGRGEEGRLYWLCPTPLSPLGPRGERRRSNRKRKPAPNGTGSTLPNSQQTSQFLLADQGPSNASCRADPVIQSTSSPRCRWLKNPRRGKRASVLR